MFFWAGSTVSPKQISDVRKYNRANGIMWMWYAASFVVTGVVGLLSIVVGAVLLLTVCFIGLPILIAVYKRIYTRYENTENDGREN